VVQFSAQLKHIQYPYAETDRWKADASDLRAAVSGRGRAPR
jgi:hypothetical protein